MPWRGSRHEIPPKGTCLNDHSVGNLLNYRQRKLPTVGQLSKGQPPKFEPDGRPHGNVKGFGAAYRVRVAAEEDGEEYGERRVDAAVAGALDPGEEEPGEKC